MERGSKGGAAAPGRHTNGQVRSLRVEEDFSRVLNRAKFGDAHAWEAIYSCYSSRLGTVLRRRITSCLRARYDTVDLAQSVLADVVRDLPRFEDRGEPAFRHWLYIKAENKVRSKLRKCLDRHGRVRESPVPVVPPGECERTPFDVIVESENHAVLGTALRELDETSQELVRLRVGEGLRFAEIAVRLELRSPEAARKRYARCLLQIRAKWKQASKTL